MKGGKDMKKQLVLTKKNDDYILSMKDDVNRNINIVNKVVNGEDLYNVFYENITEENEYILKTTLSDRKDIIIFNQLCALFNKIDTEVNHNCFNAETQGE